MRVKSDVLEVPGVVAPAPQRAAASRANSMRTADVVTASLLIAVGVLVLTDAVRLGIGWGSEGPKSGFVPFWLATVLILSSAVIITKAVRRGSDSRFVGREQLSRVLTVLLPATGMILLIPLVGLYVAIALYMGGSMRWGGRYSWPLSIGLPLAVVVITFFVFERWFLVPLPKGPIETLLGY